MPIHIWRASMALAPSFWMNLQAMHDLTKARIESREAVARDVRPRAA
jgi:antitoxin HigA-1